MNLQTAELNRKKSEETTENWLNIRAQGGKNHNTRKQENH